MNHESIMIEKFVNITVIVFVILSTSYKNLIKQRATKKTIHNMIVSHIKIRIIFKVISFVRCFNNWILKHVMHYAKSVQQDHLKFSQCIHACNSVDRRAQIETVDLCCNIQ